MRSVPAFYKTELWLSSDGIHFCDCECKSGAAGCHHVGAMCMRLETAFTSDWNQGLLVQASDSLAACNDIRFETDLFRAYSLAMKIESSPNRWRSGSVGPSRPFVPPTSLNKDLLPLPTMPCTASPRIFPRSLAHSPSAGCATSTTSTTLSSTCQRHVWMRILITRFISSLLLINSLALVQCDARLCPPRDDCW